MTVMNHSVSSRAKHEQGGLYVFRGNGNIVVPPTNRRIKLGHPSRAGKNVHHKLSI
jgi:hypothetical protein